MNCAFSVEDYEDYTLHEPPASEDIALFNQTGKDGPEVDNLRIDMRGRISSKWNVEIMRILAKQCVKLLKTNKAFAGLPTRSMDYFADLVKSRLVRARNMWRSAQPKAGADGFESRKKLEQHMVENKERRLRQARKNSRRFGVSRSPKKNRANLSD